MDIDFDDFDGPSKAPATKPGRFAPKNSKFKPVAKPKREPDAPIPPAAVAKVEVDDSKSPAGSDHAKIEIEQPSHPVTTYHDANGCVKMDIESGEMEVENDQDQGEEDQVVREIDVFLNSSFDANTKLYVLQYPLRPRWRPYDLDDRCEKVRLKPESAEVEVEIPLRVDSENFDVDAGDDRRMTKQVLSSSWKPPPATGYAVGVLLGKELHLNPVHAVVQLRPSMQHLKPRHPLKKMNTAHDEDMIDSVDIKNEKVTKQPKKQNKLPGAVNEQNVDTTEQWISLKYHCAMTELSSQYRQTMVARQASPIQFSMPSSDYIDSLCPAATSDKLRPKGPSRSTLLKLPLEERYKTWLLQGPPVHRFNSFKHLAPSDNDEDIFKVLQAHAQLVQGLWVAKSELKYGTNTGKEVLLRNYILLQFSKSPVFHEAQLVKQTSLRETMKGMLDEFAARRDSCRDWKFKEHPDDSFIKQYPTVVEEQKKIWDCEEPKITKVLFPNGSKHSTGDRRSTLNSTNDGPPRTTNAPPSRTPMPDETREALPKFLQKIFQTYKVCSLNQIRQRLRDMAVSENRLWKGSREAIAAAADAPEEELLKTLNQVAVKIHGAYVAKSSPDHPQYDGLRNIVINLLLAEGPKGRLKKAAIFAAANLQLKREITNIEYQKVLNELCISQNSAWVLKSGDGSPT